MGKRAFEEVEWIIPREAGGLELLPWCRGEVECLNRECQETFEAVWELGCPELTCPFCNTRDTFRIIHGDTIEPMYNSCHYTRN